MNELNLITLAKSIDEKKLVLPNFQREYVWGDNSRQIGFLASVLARIPLGNIIKFNDNKEKFACRKIGKKERLEFNDITDKNVDFLLDGQQRLTTLLLMFSNKLYQSSNGKIGFEKLLSKGLQNRFFIRLPKFDATEFETADDVFGYLKLKFPFVEIPKFCSSDIFDGDQSSIIEVKSFNRNGDEWYNPKKEVESSKSTIVSNACNNSLIPCYWILENDSILGRMLREYASKRARYLYEEYNEKDGSSSEGRIGLNKILHFTDDKKILHFTDADLKDELEERAENWATAMGNYLRDCITRLKINSFEVTNEGTERAIDIYEALNKGGVELSTYDLIIARAAKEDTNDSLNEKLEDIVKKYHNEKLLKALVSNKQCWKSTDQLDTIKKGSIDKLLVSQFLSLLCITSNCEVGKMRGSIKTDYCKDKEQLNLSPKKIWDGSEICMQSIIDAVMYLNLKQGVYKLSCIHYRLTLLPIAYAFYVSKRLGINFNSNTKEIEYFFALLNAWYKMAVFTDFYQSNQSTRVIEYICDIDDALVEKRLPHYFTDGLDKQLEYVLNITHYNDFKMLTFDEPGYNLSKAVEKYITQYYLSLKDGEIDILKDDNTGSAKRIHSYDNLKLAIHHFIPLYTQKELNTNLPKNTSEVRDSALLINSPLNKVIISSDANNIIGTLLPIKYVKRIPEQYFALNDFPKDDYLASDTEEIVSFDFLKKVYEERYQKMRYRIQADIRNSVEKMKGILNS